MFYIKNRKHRQKCLPFVGNLNSQIKLCLLFIAGSMPVYITEDDMSPLEEIEQT
jgi:hypothetical protein